MNKNVKKWGAAAGLFLLSVGMLTGCKRNTPGSLLNEAMKNSSKASSYTGNLNLGVTMGVKQDGISMDLDVGMDADIEATNKPSEYHMKGTLNLGILNMSVDTEIYGKQNKEGTKLTTYVYANDEWVKSEEDIEDASPATDVMNLDALIDKGAKLNLEKNTVKENGKEVYVITTKTSGDKLNAAQSLLGDATDGAMEEMDFSKLEGDVVIKIDKEKRLPASVSVDFKDPSGDGTTVEIDGAEITLSNLNVTITFDEYNTIDKISLPAEALDATEADSDPTDDILNGMAGDDSDSYKSDKIGTDGDGNYVIKDYSNKKEIAIVPIKNMKLEDYSTANSASFYMEGENYSVISVSYSLEEMSDYYTEDYLSKYQKEDEQYYAEDKDYSNVVFEDVKTVKAGKYDVKYTSLSYSYKDILFDKEYKAWMLTDDGFAVVCTLREGGGDAPGTYINEKKIVEIMSGIRE